MEVGAYSGDYSRYSCLVYLPSNGTHQHHISLFTFTLPLSLPFLSPVPSAPPEDLTIANITSSSLLLQWSPPPAEDQNGLIKFYTVTVMEEPTGRLIQLQSLSTERWVHHLHPFYTYTCSVAASTVGVGPFSTTITGTTLESGN